MEAAQAALHHSHVTSLNIQHIAHTVPVTPSQFDSLFKLQIPPRSLCLLHISATAAALHHRLLPNPSATPASLGRFRRG